MEEYGRRVDNHQPSLTEVRLRIAEIDGSFVYRQLEALRNQMRRTGENDEEQYELCEERNRSQKQEYDWKETFKSAMISFEERLITEQEAESFLNYLKMLDDEQLTVKDDAEVAVIITMFNNYDSLIPLTSQETMSRTAGPFRGILGSIADSYVQKVEDLLLSGIPLEEQHATNCLQFILALQVIVKRVYMGIVVARLKLSDEKWLKGKDDGLPSGEEQDDAIMRMLTDERQENVVIDRIRDKYRLAWQLLFAVGREAEDGTLFKEIEKWFLNLYKDLIIPLTKRVQLNYIRRMQQHRLPN